MPRREKNPRFFRLETLKNCILNENFTHRWPQSGHFFHKLGHFFPIFEKGQGKPSPFPPSNYAPEVYWIIFILSHSCHIWYRYTYLLIYLYVYIFVYIFTKLAVLIFFFYLQLQWFFSTLNAKYFDMKKYFLKLMSRLLHSTIHQVMWYFWVFIVNLFSLLWSFFSQENCASFDLLGSCLSLSQSAEILTVNLLRDFS